MKLYSDMNSTNTALLVVDPINSCSHEKCEIPEWGIHFTKIRDMLPKLKDFIQQFKEEVNGLVIYIDTTPWQKDYLTHNINELYKDPKTTYYSSDDTGFAEEFYVVKPGSDDLIVTKNHYDVFTTEGFDENLKSRGIRYLVVTGIFGDGCVLASIVGGFSKGYNFVILEDLVETTDVPIRQVILANLMEFTFPIMYGLTMKSNQFLEYWSEKSPQHPSPSDGNRSITT